MFDPNDPRFIRLAAEFLTNLAALAEEQAAGAEPAKKPKKPKETPDPYREKVLNARKRRIK